MVSTLSPVIQHSEPHLVPLKQVEDELGALRKSLMPSGTFAPALRACTLTLAILCDGGESPEDLGSLIERIVDSHPARVLSLAQNRPEDTSELETRVSAYMTAPEAGQRLVGEEVAFYPSQNQYAAVPGAVLTLRVSGLPFVLYWRGQPDLEDPLFHALVGECDQILFDSQHFTARAERINNTIARLRRDYPEVSFGDVNWQRIRPWRELAAQFFDDPANMTYLETITRVEIGFSVNMTGNQSSAILLMAWLASSLGWRALPKSYHRDGHYRSARFERTSDNPETRVIEVKIHVREQFDCMPGEVTEFRMEADGEMPAVFDIKRAVGGFVDIKQTVGAKVMERYATLVIPEDSTVITSELDAVRQDRNYHRALELLDELVAQNFT